MAPGGCFWYNILIKISHELNFFLSTSNLEHDLFRHKTLDFNFIAIWDSEIFSEILLFYIKYKNLYSTFSLQ